MRYFARVAAELLAHLGYEQADVIGFSFGGMVAQELARNYPERVRRLVLVATCCGWGGVPGGPAALAAIAAIAYRYYSPSYFSSSRRGFTAGPPTGIPCASARMPRYEASIARRCAATTCSWLPPGHGAGFRG
jgi:pimeloyl-ACP methyl ester carboxylesterase